MFYKPTLDLALYESATIGYLYSDCHKDSFGCRPGGEQWSRAQDMSPTEQVV